MKRRNQFRTIIALVAAATALAPSAVASTRTPAAQAAVLDATSTRLLTDAVTDILTSRATAIVRGATAVPVRFAGGARRVAVGLAVQETDRRMMRGIQKLRAQLASAGEEFTSTRTLVDVEHIVATGRTARMRIQETTLMYYANNRGDEPPFTSYGAAHTFDFRQDSADGWVLVTDTQHDPSGLLPLGEATTYTDPSTSSDGEPPASDLVPLPPGTDPAETAVPATGDPQWARAAAKISTSQPGTGGATSVALSYDYSAMARYLERYCGVSPCGRYNSNYRDFSGSQRGGDCTNFASQALRAGGWRNDTGWYRDPANWWYNSLNQTWSWVNVDYWASFAYTHSRRVTPLSNVWYLGVGDVLQIDSGRDGDREHTMMVSYRSRGGTPYFTYHSSNRYRRSMNLVLSDWGASDYYAGRT